MEENANERNTLPIYDVESQVNSVFNLRGNIKVEGVANGKKTILHTFCRCF